MPLVTGSGNKGLNTHIPNTTTKSTLEKAGFLTKKRFDLNIPLSKQAPKLHSS